ncbi:DUF4129 domain-containing protein [Nesterenkonia alkaliphila]|uniref:DUF4129 domain-containing protein n=1 Tax=Nesterenkonia alkaliphila TaxID=1463631 RepID=A0A7K1UK90_9MICC|nr:DUF4129 domain-containing protein [Nesterenkonia alkaliphila]MVT26889.1 DUF4129 domain-containing protein [Nesterenkonia alkaliphila]GFZ82190.1 membrane protein [Nesterenkonia alkaliphila]
MSTELHDRDQARRLLEEELASGSYQREFTGPLRQAVDDFIAWLNESTVNFGGVSVPYGPLLVLAAVLAAAVLILALVRPRLQRSSVAEQALRIDPAVPAAELRARAEGHARSGDYSAAVQEIFRALVRAAEERGAVPEQKGRTATEIAQRIAASYPAHSAGVQSAAELFNRSAYSSARLGSQDYGFLRELEIQLQGEQPQSQTSISGPRLVAPQ